MLICAFTAWVRGPSILITFILKRCHAFIISVIVVTGSSVIFLVHFLWHLITVNHSRTNSICAQLVPSMWCPNGHTSIYEPWDWLVWAIDSSQLTMVVGRLDQMSSHVVTFWVLSLAFWIKVFGNGHHWLLTPCCYTHNNKHVSCSNLQLAEPWSNFVSLRYAKASRWSASLSWKGLPSPFWLRVII